MATPARGIPWYPLDAETGLVTHLFAHLWRHGATRCTGVALPDTVVIREGAFAGEWRADAEGGQQRRTVETRRAVLGGDRRIPRAAWELTV